MARPSRLSFLGCNFWEVIPAHGVLNTMRLFILPLGAKPPPSGGPFKILLY